MDPISLITFVFLLMTGSVSLVLTMYYLMNDYE